MFQTILLVGHIDILSITIAYLIAMKRLVVILFTIELQCESASLCWHCAALLSNRLCFALYKWKPMYTSSLCHTMFKYLSECYRGIPDNGIRSNIYINSFFCIFFCQTIRHHRLPLYEPAIVSQQIRMTIRSFWCEPTHSIM